MSFFADCPLSCETMQVFFSLFVKNNNVDEPTERHVENAAYCYTQLIHKNRTATDTTPLTVKLLPFRDHFNTQNDLRTYFQAVYRELLCSECTDFLKAEGAMISTSYDYFNSRIRGYQGESPYGVIEFPGFGEWRRSRVQRFPVDQNGCPLYVVFTDLIEAPPLVDPGRYVVPTWREVESVADQESMLDGLIGLSIGAQNTTQEEYVEEDSESVDSEGDSSESNASDLEELMEDLDIQG